MICDLTWRTAYAINTIGDVFQATEDADKKGEDGE